MQLHTARLCDRYPPIVCNQTLAESLNGAQRASDYQFNLAGVTTGGGNTHDFWAAVERPDSGRRRHRRKIHPIERALRFAKKAPAEICLVTPARPPVFASL